MNIIKYFKNLSILATGLAIANTGLGAPNDNKLVTELTDEQIDQLRAIEFVSRDSKPAGYSKILYSESHLKDCEVNKTTPLISFTTIDEERISPDEIVTPQSLIECIGNDAYWKNGKRPVIWSKGAPLSAQTKTFIVLDSKDKFHYVGDLSTAKNELSDVFPLCKDELEAEIKANIKIKTKVAKLRSTIPSRESTSSTDASINSVVQNEVVSAIIDDNVTEFIRLSSDASFDTNAKIGGFSYTQLMAVFGSINCFKHAISTDHYSLDNTEPSALTSGDMETVHLVEQKGKSFDNTLENAPNCPYILFEWKVEHWKEDNILNACKECLRKGMWHYALYFVKTEDVKPEDLFIDACKYGSCFFVKNLVEKCNCNPETKSEFGNTALHVACVCGRLDIVKYLVEECHCNPEAKNNEGETPLHLVSESGHLNIVKYLVEECGLTIDDKMITAANSRGVEYIKDYLFEQRQKQESSRKK